MKVVVLGSGIIGTASAWWLRQDGHDVEVIDRAAGPARETSFANGGQLSVGHAEPWATPQAPWRLLQWLMRDDSPLLFRPRLDWRQWQWGLAFLRECRRARLQANMRAMLQLATYSLSTLRAMRRDLGIEYEHRERGILTIYRTQADFESAQQTASMLRDLGVDRRILSADEVIGTEPALAARRTGIAGGEYTASDESGDAFRFTTALAERGAGQGIAFRYGTQATRLLAEAGRVYAVETVGPDGRYARVHGDVFVVAAGSHTPRLVQPLGVPCPVYPAKGYSATFRILDPARAPGMSLTDASRKVVITPLGDRLRVAGTAELSGYSRALNTVRCEALARVAGEWFEPGVLDLSAPDYWSGLRPATPSGVPLLGRTRIANLYLNTGHGTLGWTMGPGSGRVLADLVAGRRPEPAFPFLGH